MLGAGSNQAGIVAKQNRVIEDKNRWQIVCSEEHSCPGTRLKQKQMISIILKIYQSMSNYLIVLSILITLPYICSSVICDRNSLTYLSSFALSKQNDLNETFTNLKANLTIPNIEYSPRIGKTYIISNFTPVFYFLDAKQTARFSKVNQLQVSGGSVKVTYTFNWEKKQLGSSVKGTAEGVVISDSLGFFKQIGINQQAEPEWNLTNWTNVTFTNNFPVSKVNPYTLNDSDTLFIMMNKAISHETGKQVIANSINAIYPDFLRLAIKTDSDNIHVAQTLNYSYFDYRGELKVTYDNLIDRIELDTNGLTMLFSQTIKDYNDFQCGQPLHDQVQDPAIFGGHQTFISNSLIKSTLHYALTNNFFAVRLSQRDWQSRAFQFFMGDVYEAIPNARNLSATTELVGNCSAADDETFSFSRLGFSSYQVVLNFTCDIYAGTDNVAQFSILTTSQVQVELLTRSLSFKLAKISGTPIFKESVAYPIENTAFAQFLVSETLKVAEGSQLLGTGYPTSTRLYPNLEVKQTYLYLYDSSIKPHNARQYLAQQDQ